jgi:uncharacterized protein
MTLSTVVLLFAAGVLGGIVNAVAGGATFFTFPAMIAVGLPPVIANASNSLAVAPGHLVALVALRDRLPSLQTLAVASLFGLAGGLIGALVLLQGGDRLFTRLIPFLILGATLLFALAPRLQTVAARQTGEAGTGARAVAIQGAAAVYGGYFGAGLGIMLLAALTLAGYRDLRQANAIKNLLAVLITGVAITIFIAFGVISWPETLVMLAGALAGGYVGGHLARVLPAPVIRACVIAMGLLLSAYYFWQLLAG